MQQGSLFDLPPSDPDEALGLAGLMTMIRARMNQVAGKEEANRKTLVDDINAIAKREAWPLTASGGKTITLDQLNKYLQPNEKGHDPTLAVLVCFCLAAKDARPVKPLLDILKLVVIPASDMHFLLYGKSKIAEKKAKSESSILESLLCKK